ncbi:hypothetical protein DFH28DRAFT_891476 [Melampsora americana]|nr:hypothetical protein DFH28DRAFT_891476 [Melampsora americana]
MICRILNQFITYAKLQDYPSKQRHHHSIIQDHAELEDELDELNSNSSFDKMLKSDLTIKVQASPSLVIKTQSELNLLNENDNFITDQQLSDPIIKNIKTSNQFYLSTSDLFESIDPNLLEFIS